MSLGQWKCTLKSPHNHKTFSVTLRQSVSPNVPFSHGCCMGRKVIYAALLSLKEDWDSEVRNKYPSLIVVFHSKHQEEIGCGF